MNTSSQRKLSDQDLVDTCNNISALMQAEFDDERDTGTEETSPAWLALLAAFDLIYADLKTRCDSDWLCDAVIMYHG